MHTIRHIALALSVIASVVWVQSSPVATARLGSGSPPSLNSGYGVDGFGGSVALSADGTIALVGAYGKSGGNGAAYVFRRSAHGWKLQEKLVAKDGAPADWFGWAVALSADGATAMVGALGKYNQAGAAYVFVRHADHWSEIQELTASDPAKGDNFGRSVALNGAGTVALIGADAHRGGGAAYIFVRGAADWSQGQMLSPSDGSNHDYFGLSVALSNDGMRALIGAYNHRGGRGAAYVFGDHGGTGWKQQGDPLSGNSQGHADFGNSVALSADGETALIGAPWTYFTSGAAYVFGHTSNGWGLGQVLVPHDRTSETFFGWRVALSGDGKTALIGAPWKNSVAGAAYVFGRSMVGWHEEQILPMHTGVRNQQFGMAVATSKDGRTLLIGAEGSLSTLDAAYSFTRTTVSMPHWSAQQQLAYTHFPPLKPLRARLIYTGSPSSFRSVGPVATDSAGDLFVADEHACRVVELTPSGVVRHVWGSRGTGKGQFNPRYMPCIGGIAVARSGNILATDTWDGRVLEFAPAGTLVRSWGRLNFSRSGAAADEFYGPRGLAVGFDGEIYVADTGHDRIQVFDADGNFVRSMGSAGAALGQFDEPSSIAVDASGRVFVADYWHSRVQVFSGSGTPLSSFAVSGWQSGDYDEPEIAVDSRDRVLVPVPSLGLMMLYARDGTLLYGWRTGVGALGRFSKPRYTAVNAAGLVVVADSANEVVTSFSVP